MNEINVDYWWPTLHFGPVNLWTVMPALMFHSSREKQEEMVWCEHSSQYVHAQHLIVVNSPLLGKMASITALR